VKNCCPPRPATSIKKQNGGTIRKFHKVIFSRFVLNVKEKKNTQQVGSWILKYNCCNESWNHLVSSHCINCQQIRQGRFLYQLVFTNSIKTCEITHVTAKAREFLFWSASRQNKRLSPLSDWVRFSLQTHKLSKPITESRGFSQGDPEFPPLKVVRVS
jgi:hypothetical protein